MYQLDRIKAAQNLRGFSHSRTAEALDIPLATFKKYLSGERSVPYDFWKKLSQIFNVPLSFFTKRTLHRLECLKSILEQELGSKHLIRILSPNIFL